MRKIVSREYIEKKQSRDRMIIGLVLISLMILSTAGYAFYSSDKKDIEKINYNGFEFVRNNGFWDLEVSGQKFSFQYLPNESFDIEINLQKSLADYTGKVLYFSEKSLGSQEILMNIGRYVERAQLACFEESCEDDLPIKNCSDNFIIFRESNFSKIVNENNCVYIISNFEDQVRSSDAFLYKILGII